MELLNLLRDNWFELLQSLGIITGFFFASYSSWEEAKQRRVANRLEITKQHREIWSTLYSRPDLTRVIDSAADLAAQPVTHEEQLFVRSLILHLAAAFRASRAGMFKLPDELKTDIAIFFSHPVPRAVWEVTKHLQNADFVWFVEQHRAR